MWSYVRLINEGQALLTATTYCKQLQPTWESLAEDFATESMVLVAKVDAEAESSKATAKDQGVTSYPTIKFYPRGSKVPLDYTGARSEEALVTYLNEKAGTHRSVGGGLNSQAGTIDVLDLILAKVTTGQTLASVSDDISRIATTLTDRYAEYYSRVATKMSSSSDYAQKELKRLEGMLEKGGLAPAKKDDVTSRSNILRKFVVDAEEKIESFKEEL